MLLIEETKNQFGYNPSILSQSSHKHIFISCDYCNSQYKTSIKNYHNSRKILPKDCCSDCKYKKRKEVSLLTYGVENSAQRPAVKVKIAAANKQRLQSPEYKEQIKQIVQSKYGVDNVMKSQEIVDRLKTTVLDKYGVENISQLPEIKEKATKKMLKTRISNGTITLYNGKTRPEIAKELGFSRSHFGKLVNEYGIEKALTMVPHESSLETQFKEWLKEKNIGYEQQFRVGNKIADFKIGDNILVELDGLYWHSEAVGVNKTYHEDKRKHYIDSGFSPLFFRENELKDKWSIVQSVVLNKLRMSVKLMARKCELKPVDKQQAFSFFSENHLMGNGKGKTHGLYYDGQLISAIQIKKIKDGNEISRFCNKMGYSVTGAFSRLFKSFNVENLITFIDLRYGSGHYLNKLGFEYCGTHPSFKWTDGKSVFNRMKFPGKSGYENGLTRIWDCGQSKYRWCI